MGFGLKTGFTDHLQVVTTSNCNTVVNFHTLQITTAHAKSSQSAVFTGHSLVMASNSEGTLLAPIKSSLHRPPYNSLYSKSKSKSKSKSLYNWRFTVNQFVLAPSPSRLAIRGFFFQLNSCGHSPYITSSLTQRWVCPL
jgi:hypothetical protein